MYVVLIIYKRLMASWPWNIYYGNRNCLSVFFTLSSALISRINWIWLWGKKNESQQISWLLIRSARHQFLSDRNISPIIRLYCNLSHCKNVEVYLWLFIKALCLIKCDCNANCHYLQICCFPCTLWFLSRAQRIRRSKLKLK